MSVVSTDSKYGFVQVPDFGSSTLLQLKTEFDQDFAREYFELCKSTVAFNSRCVPLVYGSSRASSSGSVGSSCGGLRSPSGPTATRLASIQAVDSWRRTGLAVPGKKKVPSGFCYTKLLTRECAESVAVGVGAYPTFATLTRMAARKFQSLECLERFRLVEQGPGVYHVAAGGTAGVSFLGAVYGRALAMPGTPSGSFVDTVAAAGVRDDVATVDPKAVVGGPGVMGSCRVFKDEVGVSKVMVSLGDVRRDPGELALRLEVLKGVLGEAPEVFDCLYMQGGDWGYLSSSSTLASEEDEGKLRSVLEGAGYVRSTTAWGVVRYDLF